MNDRIYIDAAKPQWKGNLHMHTVRSDGKLTPKQLVDEYRALGFSFCQISDHEIYWNSAELDSEDFVVLGGTESSVRMNRDKPWLLDYRKGFGHRHMHFGCILDETVQDGGQRFEHDQLVPRVLDRGIDSWNRAVSFLKKHDNLVYVNHPDWSRLAPELLLAVEGCFAMEVWNSGNMCYCAGRDDSVIWDYCLRHGKHLYAIAGDDAHLPGAALGASFIMASAERLDKKALITAIKNGEFYASTGPVFHDIRVENGQLKMKFSPAEKVSIVAFDGEGHTRCAPEGGFMEQYEWTIPEHLKYVRAMIVDEKGRTAWAQPVFIEELMDIEDFVSDANPVA